MTVDEHAAQAAKDPDRDADKEREAAKHKKIRTIVGTTLIGILAICFVAVAVSANSGPQPPDFRVSDVSYTTSPAGRVEVSFTVTNISDQAERPSCTVRAEDADGFRKGSDRLDARMPVSAGAQETYRVVTGINADGVMRVIVQC